MHCRWSDPNKNTLYISYSLVIHDMVKKKHHTWGSGLEYVFSAPCLSYHATIWECPSGETSKIEALCHSKCGTFKIPLCSAMGKILQSANYGETAMLPDYNYSYYKQSLFIITLILLRSSVGNGRPYCFC